MVQMHERTSSIGLCVLNYVELQLFPPKYSRIQGETTSFLLLLLTMLMFVLKTLLQQTSGKFASTIYNKTCIYVGFLCVIQGFWTINKIDVSRVLD